MSSRIPQAFVVLIFVFSFSLLACRQASPEPTLGGSWESSLILASRSAGSLEPAYESTLEVTYGLETFEVGSFSEFTNRGFESQEFSLQAGLDGLELSLEAEFSPRQVSFYRYKAEAQFTLGEVEVTDSFHLTSWPPWVRGFGAGKRLAVDFDLSETLSASIYNYFGMYRNWYVYKRAALPYVSTVAYVDGGPYRWGELTLEGKVSAMEGLEYLTLDALVEHGSWPVFLQGVLDFCPEEGLEARLDPEVEAQWGQVGLFAGWATGRKPAGGPELVGFTFSEVSVGSLEAEGFFAFGDYTVYDLNYYLRAYDTLFRLQTTGSGRLDFTLDTYFRTDGESGNLFGFCLLEIEAEYGIGEDLAVGTQLEAAPGEGLEEVVFSVDTGF